MYCVITGHQFINDVQSISQIFFQTEKFTVTQKPAGEGVTVTSRLSDSGVTSGIYENGTLICEASLSFACAVSSFGGGKKYIRNSIQKCVFEVCMRYRPSKVPWGLLVGIRPTKIVHEMWAKGLSDDEIIKHLTGFYLVSEDRAGLCIDVAKAGKDILSGNDGGMASLYIGIPFCVSRCRYCSFSSYTVKQYGKLTGKYIAALIKELEAAAEYLKNKRVQSVYIGGGTPTSLDADLLEKLMGEISKRIDIKNAEYTVEAGRPDTIDEHKLDIIKAYGAGRVCVNPQTLNGKTLLAIGRGHSAESFFKAYELARGKGFTVNVDLILGLAGETAGDVKNTLNGVLNLAPDNLTIHTLAVKRASLLKESLKETGVPDSEVISQMLEYASAAAGGARLKPYYMYRQKNMPGNFENIGYCREGKECVYNIQIIEEKQTIVAIGAGAATKHVNLEKNLVRRIYNVKTPEEYIGRIDEMIERKNKLYEYDNEGS